jgi:hypothetical protein
MGRSLLVLGFIAAVFGVGVYAALRPTVASGEVLGAELTEANSKHVKEMRCDKHIPVGAHGARFACEATFHDGESARLEFTMDREGMIHQAGETQHPKVKHSSDPWNDD